MLACFADPRAFLIGVPIKTTLQIRVQADLLLSPLMFLHVLPLYMPPHLPPPQFRVGRIAPRSGLAVVGGSGREPGRVRTSTLREVVLSVVTVSLVLVHL